MIAASIMCADQLALGKELDAIQKAKIGWLHCDVMDGVFVNNLAMGPYNIKPLVENGNFIIDIHLATQEPEKYIDMFSGILPHYITFHVEATNDPGRLIEKIKSYGIKAGIAFSPDTPFSKIQDFVSQVDLVLVMTVNPGFTGQSFRYDVLDKLKELKHYIKDFNEKPLLSVDGNIYDETVKKIVPIGADVYILGTSALFDGDGNYSTKVVQLEQIIEGGHSCE